MTTRKSAAAAVIAAGLVLFEPVRSMAATTTDCNPVAIVPESPMGPALLIVAALTALGVVAHRRRRAGVVAVVISTLAVVVVCGALIGSVIAAAATSSCPGGGTSSPPGQVIAGATSHAGQVSGIASSVPLTGADIPWITGTVLVLGGAAVVAILPRRRRRKS